MFISNIKKFLPQSKNYKKSEFIDILGFVDEVWFDIYKLEKDFLLTLILIKFGEKYPKLIFKGGTCLNKIYFPYFRLSEDLDFVINTDWWQSARKRLLKKYENYFAADLNILGLKLKNERKKFDSYKLAMFTFEYKSVINNSWQTIKIDLSLKNPLQLSAVKKEIKSFYVNKETEENLFDKHFINCIDLKESVAEKVRATMTRKKSAIRDFFDIWYIKNCSDFNFNDKGFKELVDIKLKEADNNYCFEDNYVLLKRQIKTDLKPVLNREFDFDLDEVWRFLQKFIL